MDSNNEIYLHFSQKSQHDYKNENNKNRHLDTVTDDVNSCENHKNSQHNQIQEFSDSNSLWIIENENTTRGGQCTFSKFYRFKHVATGMYLALDTKLISKCMIPSFFFKIPNQTLF